MTRKPLVFGRHGQVASALFHALGSQATFLARDEAPFEEPSRVVDALERCSPSIVIVPAAYTQVDKAESEAALCRTINTTTPGEIARWASRNDAAIVHFSTDYVFPGAGDTAQTEDQPTAPLNVYGLTKRDGENEILESGAKAIILRTSWVFSHEGQNFLKTMIRLGTERETLKVVADQVGAPTYAPHLAAAVTKILPRLSSLSGGTVYHLTNRGETTWHSFAERIFNSLRGRARVQLKVGAVEPIPTSAYPTPARRPLNSRLDCTKIERELGVRLPSWQDGVENCLDQLERLP